jgi:hypothetical protein
MEIQTGDWVLVNLAPFIGSSQRSHVGIPCRVLAVSATHVEVATEHPFREVALRVRSTWIEAKLKSDEGQPRLRTSRAVGVRKTALAAAG